MFTNPKREIKVDFSLAKVKESIKRLSNSYSDDYIPIIKDDEILNMMRLHRKGNGFSSFDFGYHVDIHFEVLGENKTSISIEISKNMGSINTPAEDGIANNILKMVLESISRYITDNELFSLIAKNKEKYEIKDSDGNLMFVDPTIKFFGAYKEHSACPDEYKTHLNEVSILNSNHFSAKKTTDRAFYNYKYDDGLSDVKIRKTGKTEYAFSKKMKTGWFSREILNKVYNDLENGLLEFPKEIANFSKNKSNNL